MAKPLLAGLALGAIIGGGMVYALNDRRSPVERPPGAGPVPAPVPLDAGFSPPSAAAAPKDAWGDAVRMGENIMRETRIHAPENVGNSLACANCHLDGGRTPGAAPLWAAFPNFPAYRAKNKEINSFQKRAQDCFLYSMNGMPPALGSPVLLALESYAFYMAKGLPIGESPKGRGFPKLADPAETPSDARGTLVYAEHCASCHGLDGAGQVTDGKQLYPPLWGAKSYNWGAGMATIDKAAAFIHANMPLGMGGTLTPQQAWDVATYIDGKPRPQDPRFKTSPEITRAANHNNKFSRYGTIVDGKRLGDPASTPPAGFTTGG